MMAATGMHVDMHDVMIMAPCESQIYESHEADQPIVENKKYSSSYSTLVYVHGM